MDDNLMYIPNENRHNNSFSQNKNCWLKILDTTILKPTNENSIKVPEVFEPTNKTTWLKAFYSQMSPPFLLS